jgi:hypothetical protein
LDHSAGNRTGVGERRTYANTLKSIGQERVDPKKKVSTDSISNQLMYELGVRHGFKCALKIDVSNENRIMFR